MKVRNKSENIRYRNHVESAIDEIQQAIDTITYSSYPEINKRIIEKLQNITELMENALDACICKP